MQAAIHRALPGAIVAGAGVGSGGNGVGQAHSLAALDEYDEQVEEGERDGGDVSEERGGLVAPSSYDAQGGRDAARSVRSSQKVSNIDSKESGASQRAVGVPAVLPDEELDPLVAGGGGGARSLYADSDQQEGDDVAQTGRGQMTFDEYKDSAGIEMHTAYEEVDSHRGEKEGGGGHMVDTFFILLFADFVAAGRSKQL